MTVNWVSVGEILRRSFETVEVDPQQQYPMFGVRNRSRGAFDAGEMSGADTKYKTLSKAAEGDVVYLKLGAWEGAFAMIPRELDGRHASSEFVLYRPDPNRVVPAYLAHLIAWPELLERIGSKSKGTNVRRRRLSPPAFEAAAIPLPDLDTQASIAARLDAISRVAAKASEIQASECLAQTRDRRVAEAIAGAEEIAIGSLVELPRLPVLLSNGANYRPIGVRSFGKGLIEYPETSANELSKLAYFELPEDSLVVSNIKAWEGAVVHHQGGKGLIASSRFLCYTAKRDDVLTAYLAEYLKTPPGTSKLASASPGSADRNRTLGRKRFESIHVPVPSLDAQREILAEVKRFGEIERTYMRRKQLAGALLPGARSAEFRKLLSA